MRIRSYFQNNNKNGKSISQFIEILKEAIIEDCYINEEVIKGVTTLVVKPIKKIISPDVHKKGEGFKQKDIVDRITNAVNYSVVIHDWNSKEHVIKCTVAGKKIEVLVKPTVLRYITTHTPSVAGNPTASVAENPATTVANPTAPETGVAVANPKKTSTGTGSTVGKTYKSTWTPKKKKEKPIDRREKATEPEPVKPKVKKYKTRVDKVFLNDDERFPIFKFDSPSSEKK